MSELLMSVESWLGGAAVAFLAAAILLYGTLLGSLIIWIRGTDSDQEERAARPAAPDSPMRRAA